MNSRALVAVTGNNVTIAGLGFTVDTTNADPANPVDGQGLMLFVTGNAFTLNHSKVDLNRTNMITQSVPGTAIAAVVFYDTDPVVNANKQITASSIQSFSITNNILGGMINPQNGAGFGAPSSSLVISGNTITKGFYGAIYLQGNLNDPGNPLSMHDVGLPLLTGNNINTSDLPQDDSDPAIGNAAVIAAVFTNPNNAPGKTYVEQLLSANTVPDSAYVLTSAGATRYQGNINNPPPLSTYGFNVVPAITYISGGVEEFVGDNQASSAPAQPGDTLVVSSPDFDEDTLTGDGLTVLFNSVPSAGFSLSLSAFAAPSQTVPFTRTVTINRGTSVPNSTSINVIGNAANNIINADAGDSTITGGPGNDTLNGGAGFDTAAYSGAISDYRFSFNATTGSLVVTDLRPGSPDGTDTLTGFDALAFATGSTKLTVVQPSATIASGIAAGTTGVLILGNHAVEQVTIGRALAIVGAVDAASGTPVSVGSFTISTGAGLVPGSANAQAPSVNVATGALAQDGATLTANNGTLTLAAGNYAETLTLSRNVRLLSAGATVTAIVLAGAQVNGSTGVVAPAITVQPGSKIAEGLSLVTSGGVVTALAGTFPEDIQFTGTATLAGQGGQVIISGATATPLVVANSGSTPSSLTVSGQVALATSLPGNPVALVSGTSSLILDGNNALSGATVSVGATATLSAKTGTNSTNPVTLAGGTISAVSAGTVIFSGPVTLGATNTTLNAVAGATLIIRGAVDAKAGGAFTKQGAGTIVIDSQAPAAFLATPSVTNGNTNGSPIAFTLDFRNASQVGTADPVTGLTLSDLDVSGGTATNLQGSGASYTFDVIPTGNGPVIVSLPAGKVQDAALFDNTASNTVIVNFDTSRPTVTPVTLPGTINAALNQTTTATIVVDYSDIGSGVNAASFSTGNISVSNGATKATVTGFSNSANRVSYTIAAPASTWGSSTQGSYTITVGGSPVTDLAANTVASGTIGTFTVDTVAPSPTSITPSGATNASPVVVTLSFSEPFSTSDTSKISASGATLSDFAPNPGAGTISFNATPSADGTVTIVVGAGTVTDAAGNAGIGGPFTFVSDRAAPTVSSVNAPAVNATQAGATTTTITITYADSLSGINPASIATNNIAVSNGATVTGANLSGNVATYTITAPAASWLASTQGSYAISLGASPARDLAGNTVASLTGSFLVQTTPPSPTFSFGTTGTVINAVETITLSFSNPVTGLTLSDISTAGSTGSFSLSNLQGSGASYTFQAAPQNQGSTTLQISLTSGSVTDAAGNTNTAPGTTTQNFSLSQPVPVLALPTVTNLSPITVTLTFGTVVNSSVFLGSPTNFLSLTNATYSAGSLSPATSSASFTFEIIPNGQGPVSATVLAGGFSDGSQTNIASGTASTLYDTASPTVSSIVAPNVLASQTSASITTVTINYADSLAGVDPSSFNTGNITVANGANVIGINATGNSVNYTITSPAANWGLSTQGTYGISLGGSPVRDLAGNAMTTLSGSFTVDTIAPGATVTLAPVPGSASNATSFTATVVFDQPVGDTLVNPPVLTNASIGAITPAVSGPSNTTFSFTLTPINTGAVSILIPGGAALDAAGNPSTASNTVSFTSDRVAPVGLLANQPATVNMANAGNPVTFSVAYSDIGSGINASTLSSLATTVTVPGGGTLTPTVSGTNNNTVTYNLNLGSNPAQGLYTVSLTNPGTVADNAGNLVGSANLATFLVDTVAPAATVSFDTGNSPTNTNPLAVTVVFSETVSQFGPSDLTIAGATLTPNTFNANPDGKTFTFSVTPSSTESSITVGVAAGAALDLAGNPSTAGSATRVFDSLAPTAGPGTVSIPFLNKASTFPSFTVSIPLDGGLAGINSSTLASAMSVVLASNSQPSASATLASFTNGVAAYTITPLAGSFPTGPEGTYQFRLSGVADLAGNGLATTTVATIVVDFTSPTATITFAAASPTNLAPLGATITFSEPVVGFDLSKLTLTNATPSQLSQVDSKTFSFVINPNGSGPRNVSVTVAIAAGAVNDSFQNPVVASSSSLQFDSVAPVPTVSYTGSSNPTSNTQMSFSVSFSENLPTGAFTATSLSVTNGSVQSVTAVSGSLYNIVVNPQTQGAVSVGVPAGVTADAAGNPNSASNTVSITFDSVAPVLSISPPINAAGTVSGPRIVITLTTSEPTRIANASLLTFVGATVLTPLASVGGSQTTYQVTIASNRPALRTPITINAASGLFADFAGNITPAQSRQVTYQPLGSSSMLLGGSGSGRLIGSQNLMTVILANGLRNDIPVFPGYKGGISLATADVTGDGFYDYIITPSSASASTVLIINGVNGVVVNSFNAFPAYRGGINVAAGDINGDGSNEIIVGTMTGVATVAVFNSTGSTRLVQFQPFGASFRAAAQVSAIDTTGGGTSDIVTAAGSGGSPLVRTYRFSNNRVTMVSSFFAFSSAYRGGVTVAAGDLNGDGRQELIVGTGGGTQAEIRVYNLGNPANPVQTARKVVFAGFTGAANVGIVDYQNSGNLAIIVGAGPGSTPTVNILNGRNLAVIDAFFAFERDFRGGVSVA
ncbi:MAG: Ig-like domain-containing protein [Planctomycetota bacterium]